MDKWGQITFRKHSKNVVCPRFLPGTDKIEIDVKRLQQDIDSGVLPNTKFLTNQEVTTELQTKVDAARDKFTNNSTPKNQTSLDRAETDLANAVRDGECLIKGCVPADYIKPVKK